MTRLLIRSGKDPFTPVKAETTYTQDVFNSNSGNFLFQHAVWRHLSTPGAELVSNGTLSERQPPGPDDAARINEEFDHFVVPLANAFRPDFVRPLGNLTELIEQLTIPVTVVGVGSQAALSLPTDAVDEVDEPTRRFVAAVLERSASIGVRGEFTRDHLVRLGFPASAVDVIGCPSLYLHGRDHAVTKKVDRLTDDSPLALNLTPEVPGIGAFATEQAERHPNLVYLGQDKRDLALLLWGVEPVVEDPLVPVHLDHPLYRQGRQAMFVDTWTWYDFLAERDFAYGTRFHGNVAALLAGTPAMLLAHDSRTLELARYHRMPSIETPRFDAPIDVHALYEATDLAPFNAAMGKNFDRYVAFLERNGLEHRYGPAGADPEFDARLATVTLPRRVEPLGSDIREIADRLQWIRNGMILDITRHADRYQYPFEHPTWSGGGSRFARRDAELRGKVAQLRRDDAALRKQLDRTRERLDATHARVIALEQSRLRPRLGRLKQRLLRLVGLRRDAA